MAWHIVKNPETNNYQIFSTIVDAFLLDDELTKEELEDFWEVQRGRGKEDLSKILAGLDKGVANGITWEKALMWDVHQREHGIKNRLPETCGICSDIAKDEAEHAKKGRS